MARPAKEDRSGVAGETLTLRLTPGDRAALDALVTLRASELAAEGVDVTATSYVRSLIRREAHAKGVTLQAPAAPPPPVTTPAVAPSPPPVALPKASAAERTAPLPFDEPKASPAKKAATALAATPPTAKRASKAKATETTDLDAASVRARLNAFLHDSATPRSAFAKRVGVEAPHLAAFLAARRDLSDAQRAAIDAALKKG